MADLRFCAHFPFAPEARAWVRAQKLQLDSAALAAGEERLRKAFASGELAVEAGALESEQRQQILSYAASRLILAAWGNRWAARRMAVAESKRAHDYLKSAEDRRAAYAQKLADSLGLPFMPAPLDAAQGDEKNESVYLLPFWHYLRFAPRDVHYKLVNMKLEKGQVRVSDHQRLRILEEAIRKRLEEPIPPLKEAPAEVKGIISRLEVLLPRENLAPTKIEMKDFPPCIRKLIDDLRMSVNVPHLGRVALAIYLIKAGLPDEQIAELFANAPDYNPETTAYQIKYARQKGYSVPSCATMDMWGLCIAVCRCGSPVYYREAKHGRNARDSLGTHTSSNVSGWNRKKDEETAKKEEETEKKEEK